MEEGSCVIERLSRARFSGVPFALPKQALRSTEGDLVRDVLQMVQGHPSNSFAWDESSRIFLCKSGLHLSHLSGSSLRSLLNRFINAASSLRRIDSFVQRVRESSCSSGPSHASPTLQAFASAVSLKLQHLRKGAVEKEMLAVSGSAGTSITLLGLLSSLSWVCAGSEFLEQIVNEGVPHAKILHEKALSAAELGAQLLSFLHDKMSEYCLLQDGEEEAYGTLLMLFAGTLQPLTDALNSWLHEGFLDDPFGELFFNANKSVAIEDAAFWQNGFHLRYFKPQKSIGFDESQDPEHLSASDMYLQSKEGLNMQQKSSYTRTVKSTDLNSYSDKLACPNFLQHVAKSILSAGKSLQLLQHVHSETAGEFSSSDLALKTSSLLPSLKGLGSSYCLSDNERMESMKEVSIPSAGSQGFDEASYFKNSWNQWRMQTAKSAEKSLSLLVRPEMTASLENNEISGTVSASCVSDRHIVPSLVSESARNSFSLSQSVALPPLDDDDIYEAIFVASDVDDSLKERACTVVVHSTDAVNSKMVKGDLLVGTDYGTGFGCGSLLVHHAKIDTTAMGQLFPASTMLPSSNEGWSFFGLHPMQLKNRFAEKIFHCLEKAELKVTPLPQMLVQECLIKPIQKQVESVGKQVLNKLMNEWRLMEELSILRAVYLIGSGDLLQQFSSVLFNKLDRGEPWDDFYELNTMLQESVRSSADGVLLPALDALVVTVQNKPSIGTDTGSGPVPLHIPGRNLTFGIDILDSLSFVYKVSWPLELIINKNAIKKYNQVMTFLFKVKRAKFALDKACRWMWKDGVGRMTDIKQQLLLQQKLMHFVNTLHQYVMDRVLYSAWEELCQGMAMACSLDEVIACHDAYLVSIQRQCLVAPDKLWALISSRVKTILSLALDFYSIQRTLFSGGAAPAIKARCQLEIERVGRQFEECIVFLLRVLSFKLNVGHFPHLAELVTRINYNFYYVSESGHLLTPLPEVTGRKGSQQVKIPVVNHG
ncbi:hypothetical protein GOP47_0009416 [Adiantum capillus-veneris]|uniref:Gamma-tubulin complex component n=1 Tax=Adiantum capillus-veneris TaxID=13818 RepID=A0A9D4ZJM5_ADICA|nr:hypothetical protein GOP47_0009416 [Adiantum capillus-veneris]